jgi:hypothetical protein
MHVKRRTIRWERLTKITHPVMIKEKMHPAGQGVPRLEPFYIDCKWGISAAAGL